jgi:hypothetical protein
MSFTLSNVINPAWSQWVGRMLGNQTTNQGGLRDCYFLSALDAVFNNPQATDWVMQTITPINETEYWVKRGDGRTVKVDLSATEGNPERVQGPLAYRVLEAAYRDIELSEMAPYPSSFDEGGYSVDVWLNVLRGMPGITPVQIDANDWQSSLAQSGQGNAAAVLLYQAADSNPPALITASTMKMDSSQLVKSQGTYSGLGNRPSMVYKRYGHEWMPHHVYSITRVWWQNGNLMVAVDNPYVANGKTQAQTILALPQFLDIFSRLDGLQLPPSE